MARLLLDAEQAGRFRCAIATRSTGSSSRSPKAKALVLVTCDARIPLYGIRTMAA